MSRIFNGLVAALTAAGSLGVVQAQAQSQPPSQSQSSAQTRSPSPVHVQSGQPRIYYGGRGGPCGMPQLGEAPDIMTYDRTTGTQVFVGGGRGDANVAAYNARTGSSAALNGDLSKPGLVSSCAVDGFSRDGYGYGGSGQAGGSGRDSKGQRWAFTRADGQVELWDPRGDNRCFKSGLGFLGPNDRPSEC
jgi:hypothetical protein